ncbi:FAD-dependent oxidoreductase [Janibacter sp. YIM B02568]|uniref:NAD(P)/FAD-dependent oxidoreductase n=1 Tax=Janibacter endophyticus TaxID=2806261 RepID=UPI00194F510E|nr:FAD-dependent oxidoreductase [Janibacter endophyticus]MBM6545366.1 FAD-dependent oxidoreductase [Janibacter endophyticus]
MSESPRSVLVVGGGIAGVSTVSGLRRHGFEGEIVLVDPDKLPYDRPPLSKEYLAGGRDLDGIALQAAQWYVDQDVTLVGEVTVTSVHPDEHEVVLSDGRVLTPDRVVLATGGRAARPPIPGVESPRVHVLRERADADRLREDLRPGARLLVVGAGLIGAEVASTANDLGCQVTLVDPVAVPLERAVGHDLALWLHEMHARRGIETVQTTVESMRDEPYGTVLVQLVGEGEPRRADAVLLGVGMVPDTALAEAAGLETDGGVLTDAGQVTSHPFVLAVGDVARRRQEDGSPAPREEHWEAATRSADRAVATILGLPAPSEGAPWFWSDRHGHHVECIGLMEHADEVVLRGSLDEVPLSVYGLREGRVVAVASVDDATASKAGRRLVDRGVSVSADQLADTSTDLRRLLRG